MRSDRICERADRNTIESLIHSRWPALMLAIACWLFMKNVLMLAFPMRFIAELDAAGRDLANWFIRFCLAMAV